MTRTINSLSPRPDTDEKQLVWIAKDKWEKQLAKHFKGVPLRSITERCEWLGMEHTYYYHQDDVDKQHLLIAIIRRHNTVSLYIRPSQTGATT